MKYFTANLLRRNQTSSGSVFANTFRFAPQRVGLMHMSCIFHILVLVVCPTGTEEGNENAARDFHWQSCAAVLQ